MRITYFLLAVAVFLGLITAVVAYSYRRLRKISGRDWDRILAELIAVDYSAIENVSLDIIDRSGQKRKDDYAMELEPERIWELIGGMEGIETLAKNSQTLIELAFYLQKWHPEALIFAEDLRRKAREIEWQADRLRAAAKTGKPLVLFSSHAQSATAAYYVMIHRLLSLYEISRFSRFPDLQKALL